MFQLLCKDIGWSKKQSYCVKEDEQRHFIHCVRRAMQDNAAIGSLGTLVLHNASASLLT